MTARKLKRILREKPFLIDNCFTLSDAEAALLIKMRGYPDVGRTIARAKAKVDWPREAWDDLDSLMNEHPGARFARILKEKAGELVSGVRLHRRFAIICFALLLLAGFFGLVPAGRALAEQAYKIVVRIIDNILVTFVPGGNNNSTEYGVDITEGTKDAIIDQNKPQDVVFMEYQGVDEFINATGYIPVVLDAEWLTCQKIEYNISQHTGCTLVIQYATDSDALLTTTQIWGVTSDTAFFINDESFGQYITKSNKTVYYTVDSIDGNIYAEVLLGDSTLVVGTTGSTAVSDILGLFDGI